MTFILLPLKRMTINWFCEQIGRFVLLISRVDRSALRCRSISEEDVKSSTHSIEKVNSSAPNIEILISEATNADETQTVTDNLCPQCQRLSTFKPLETRCSHGLFPSPVTIRRSIIISTERIILKLTIVVIMRLHPMSKLEVAIIPHHQLEPVRQRMYLHQKKQVKLELLRNYGKKSPRTVNMKSRNQSMIDQLAFSYLVVSC